MYEEFAEEFNEDLHWAQSRPTAHFSQGETRRRENTDDNAFLNARSTRASANGSRSTFGSSVQMLWSSLARIPKSILSFLTAWRNTSFANVEFCGAPMRQATSKEEGGLLAQNVCLLWDCEPILL